MPNFDKNRIFNESPKKVLRREYENLKQDFSKLNAMKYKQFYESASLSFILENSEIIFAEPYKGLEFYKTLMENAVLPFNAIEQEITKVDNYISEHAQKMSDTQKSEYTALLESLQNRYDKMKNSSCLYDTLMENTDDIMQVYDDLYEYTKDENKEIPDSIKDLMESDNINLLDTMNVVLGVPELHSEMVEYLESCYNPNPKTPEDYALNTFTTNVISRMMKDSYFSEKVSHIPNMNLRHFIMGLGGVKTSEIMDDVLTEHVKNYDPMYSTTENSVNRIFEDDTYSELFEDTNIEEKMNRLLCEKAVLDINMAFMNMDFMSEGTITQSVNSVVEELCIESTIIEKIPQELTGQIKLLQEKCDEVDSEIDIMTEKYFSADGSPSRVVAYSIGKYGQDKMTSKDAKDREPEEIEVYAPKKREKENHDGNQSSDTESDDDDSHAEQDEEDKDLEKRNAAKKRHDDKYSNMDIDDDEFKSVMEAEENKLEEKKEKKGLFQKKEKPPKVEKPEKKPFFQRVQNKALDANVQFKKTVAKGQRTAQDARNAGKAVAKVPMNVSDSIKRTVSKWDELDDNRRKEYIIQPGYRKKYFKALQLAIMHGVAWSINPLLNIVLAITHKLSAHKDERIKNELVRELKAEIKVTEEKIEDARSNGDNQQKYKLIRIKEKLDAELVRVGANAKFI